MESKEQSKQANKTQTDSDTENRLMVARGEGVGGLGEKGEGIKKSKLVVTEQTQGCKVQHKEYNQ